MNLKVQTSPFETYVPYFLLNWTVFILKRIIETDGIWRSILYLIGMGEGQKIHNGTPNKIGEMIPLELTKILFWRCSDEFSPGSLGSLFPEIVPFFGALNLPPHPGFQSPWHDLYILGSGDPPNKNLHGWGGAGGRKVDPLIRVQVLISPKFDIESPSFSKKLRGEFSFWQIFFRDGYAQNPPLRWLDMLESMLFLVRNL